MTGAGSPFPYKKDPKDSVIRIAPTYPSIDELKKATEVFVVVTRLVSVNKILEKTSTFCYNDIVNINMYKRGCLYGVLIKKVLQKRVQKRRNLKGFWREARVNAKTSGSHWKI